MAKTKYFILIIILLGIGKNLIYSQTREIDKVYLSKKIDSMVKVDQNVQQDILKAIQSKKAVEEIDSITELSKKIYAKNCLESISIFSQYGYPDFDLVGKESSYNFWLIVQHCDEMKEFQKKVLGDLKDAVEQKKAYPENLAYLEDRVRRNYNKEQIYGTQVFRDDDGLYKPYPIYDINKVDQRRAELDLNPLQDYLDSLNSR